MLVHSVYFYLKPDLSADDRTLFATELAKLGAITSLRGFYCGTPAAVPPRPVVDATFDFAITVLVDDVAGHDIYQADPIHQHFIATCKHLWSRVQIYDAN